MLKDRWRNIYFLDKKSFFKNSKIPLKELKLESGLPVEWMQFQNGI